jgi:hypothetical protein
MPIRTDPAPTHTDEQYLGFNPGPGDDFPATVEYHLNQLVIRWVVGHFTYLSTTS